MTYLRCSIGKWKIDLTTEDGQEAFRKIKEQGLAVFRKQPGFISYRLMLADARTTVAVAEWQSRELGQQGAQ
ncbi:MAG: antibiotic biosynthesis monooxygenase, partial [Chloroflexota bacterium]